MRELHGSLVTHVLVLVLVLILHGQQTFFQYLSLKLWLPLTILSPIPPPISCPVAQGI